MRRVRCKKEKIAGLVADYNLRSKSYRRLLPLPYRRLDKGRFHCGGAYYAPAGNRAISDRRAADSRPCGAVFSFSNKSNASRGTERDILSVSRTFERQRYAGPAATRTCSSGDLCFALGLPFWGRSPEETSSGRLSLWRVRTVSLSAIRKEKWFLKHAA